MEWFVDERLLIEEQPSSVNRIDPSFSASLWFNSSDNDSHFYRRILTREPTDRIP